MKKNLLIIIVISSLFFLIFVKANSNEYSNDEVLKLGEDKYLQFLWMVDGVFNNQDEFIVNERKISDDDKIFKCEYKKKSNECIAKNFETAFHALFASNIDYDIVYGDGLTFSIYRKEKDNYYFKPSNNCNIKKMNLKHTLTIKEYQEDKIIYSVSFKDDNSIQSTIREFILIKEHNKWKVHKAYYHDLCGMPYNIE